MGHSEDENVTEAERAALLSTVVRYRQHLTAISGEQTVEAFRESPYFEQQVCGSHWRWDEMQLRIDQAALAAACVKLL